MVHGGKPPGQVVRLVVGGGGGGDEPDPLGDGRDGGEQHRGLEAGVRPLADVAVQHRRIGEEDRVQFAALGRLGQLLEMLPRPCRRSCCSPAAATTPRGGRCSSGTRSGAAAGGRSLPRSRLDPSGFAGSGRGYDDGLGVGGRVTLMEVLLRPSTAAGNVAGDGDAVQLAGLAVVVVRCVVLGDAVVEEHQLVRLPVHADHVLRAGDVGLQQAQDVLGFGVGQPHDPQPLREAADEQAPLPGQRVDPDHGVGGFEVDPGEFLPPLVGVGVFQVLGHGVVVVVGVDGPEGVSEVPQFLRQVLVGAGRGGDQGFAAVGRQGDAAQGGGLRRVDHKRDVGVPVVGAAVFAVHGQDRGLAVHGGHGGVGLGERAEAAGEAHLGLVGADVGFAEDQGLVGVQGCADLGDRVRRTRSALRSRPRISAPMREPSLVNSSVVSVATLVSVMTVMEYSFAVSRAVRRSGARRWSRRRCASGRSAVRRRRAGVDQQAEQRDGQDPGVHVRDQEAHLGIDDQVAQPGLGAHHFGGDQHQDGRGSGHPDAGEDGGDRRGQDDLLEEPEAGQAQGPGGPDQQRIHGPDAGDGVQQDREERGVGHDGDLGFLADPQQQGEHRQQGQRGGVAEDLQQRVQERVQRPVPGDQQPQRHGGHHGDAEAAGGAGQARLPGGSAAGRSRRASPRPQDLVQRREEHPGGRAGEVGGPELPQQPGTDDGTASPISSRPVRRPARTARSPAAAVRRALGGPSACGPGRAGAGDGSTAAAASCGRVNQCSSGCAPFQGLFVGGGAVGQDLAVAGVLGQADLVVQQGPDLVPVFHEGGVRADVRVAVAVRDVDVHDLLEPAGAGAEHRHALAEVDGFVDAVGDEDDGLARGLPDPQQLVLELFAGLGVQGGERLVHQQDVRLIGEAPWRWPRAASYRRRAHAGTGPRSRPGPRGPGIRWPFGRSFPSWTAPAVLQADGDVGRCRAPGEQRVLLEDDGAVLARPGHFLAVHEDLPGVGPGKPGEQVQERGLAGAAGPDQGEELAGGDVQAEVIEWPSGRTASLRRRLPGPLPAAGRCEFLGDVPEADFGCHRLSFRGCSRRRRFPAG